MAASTDPEAERLVADLHKLDAALMREDTGSAGSGLYPLKLSRLTVAARTEAAAVRRNLCAELEHARHLAYIADLAGLTPSWCRAVMAHLQTCDLGGVFAGELRRQERAHEKAQGKRPPDEREPWDRERATAALYSRAHEFYAAKVVRKSLLESLFVHCWESLIEFAGSHRAYREKSWSIREVQADIGRRLGVHDETIKGWAEKGRIPSEGVFWGAALLVLEEEVRTLSLHGRGVLVPLAAWETVAAIKNTEWVPEGKLEPRRIGCQIPSEQEQRRDRERFRLVNEAWADHNADALLPLIFDGEPDVGAVNALVTRVSRIIRRAFPDGQLRSAASVRETLVEWAVPYAIFRIGLVSGFVDPVTTDDEDTDPWTLGRVDAT